MKILVVTSLMPTATANYLVKALREARHDLIVCSDVVSPLADELAHGVVDVERVCIRNGFTPNLILFIEGGTMRLFPVGLERMTCLTAWYGIDTHMDYVKHLRIGRLFDITFIAQKEFVGRLLADGLKQVYWLPLAFAPELHPSQQPDRCYDVAYVGSNNAEMHPVRHALLARIRRDTHSLFIGTASPKKMGQIYAQTKMVFNKSVNNDINMRYFEAMGAGAVLLTDHVHDNGIEELFTAGEHFLEYRDEDSLIALIKELALEPGRCRRMGEAARNHVQENHTYVHRVMSLLAQVTMCMKLLMKPTADDYFAAFTSLLMPEEALKAAANAFDWRKTGRGQRFVASIVRIGLIGLALGIKAVERARHLLR